MDFMTQESDKGKSSIQPSKSTPHDQEHANYVFSVQKLPAFFQGLGIATQANGVRADKYKKFRQINEFIRVQKPYLEKLLHHKPKAKIVTLDFGCGNAYLTVCWHHFLRAIEKLEAETIGVERRAEPVAKLEALARQYEMAGLQFVCSEISDYQHETVDETKIVFALHACDTATDQAIVQSIKCQADLVVLAPCCHHDVQTQMRKKQPIKPFRHLYRHGILRERLGDLVTDDLRAQILLLFGYKVEVFQFIDSEHTMKNVMIVAHSRSSQPQTGMGAYEDTKKFWGVTPVAEQELRQAGLWVFPCEPETPAT